MRRDESEVRSLPKSNEGFVLVSTIWIVGLLAVIASTFAIAVRLYVKGEANLIGSMEAELAADGLVRSIAYRIASASFAEAREIPVDGSPLHCELGESRGAMVSVQDQGGLVDLNRASLNVLATLIEKAGKPGSDGKSLAEALADFRDSDSIRFGVTGGGQEQSLIATGPSMKNAPFQSVDEIDQVIPAEMADLGKLKRVFTVYSRQDGIDPDAAPAELKAMIDLDRDKGRASIPLAPSQHKTFAIDAEVTGGDGSKFRRVAMVSILREPERPFAVLEWRQASGSIENSGMNSTDRPCGELALD
jgi:general secretion pathway protein K